MTYVVGLTGGIGSGKTAVSDHFARLGVTVVDADVAARVVVEPGTPALAAIREHFGDDVLQADGTLDRAALRRLVFQDDNERRWLEALLHPLIGERILQDLAEAESPYAVFVSPLLIESGQDAWCDRVLVVDVPASVQVERTVRRDNNDAAQVEAIIATQADRNTRLAKADDVLENTGSLSDLENAVAELHRRYLALAAEKQHTEGPETV